MKKIKVTIWATIAFMLLSSCDQLRSITIDLRDYPGLDDNSLYRMIIENPNKIVSIDTVYDESFDIVWSYIEKHYSRDTVYWRGNKLFKMDLSDDSDEYLAFVEVEKLRDDSLRIQRLIRTVAAIEDGGVTIRALNDGSIVLQGSESNDAINDLWHKEIIASDYNENDFVSFFNDEIKNHPDDLYGAYLYSWDVFIRMLEFDVKNDGTESLGLKASELKKEIERYNSYMAKHCAILPLLETVETQGNISPIVVSNFTEFLCPIIPKDIFSSNICTDQGIPRVLPPKPKKVDKEPEIAQRNIFTVLVDKDNKILTTNINTGEMEPCSINQLKGRVKNFLNSNREENPLLPELEATTDTAITNYLGACKVSKGIISLQCHNSTSYDKYFQVQNELTAAINELRNELSQNKFNCANHTDLPARKRKAVERAVPMAISEAKPLN